MLIRFNISFKFITYLFFCFFRMTFEVIRMSFLKRITWSAVFLISLWHFITSKIRAFFSVVNRKRLSFLTLTQSPILGIKIPLSVHIISIALLLILSSAKDCRAESGWQGDWAITTKTDTLYFDKNLSPVDTDVQKALDTLDDLIAGGSNGPDKVKVTTNDTTAEYLDDKVIVTAELTKEVVNPGGVEQLRIGLYHGIDISAFSNNVGVVEKGVTVDDATFVWTLAVPGQETDQTITPPLEHIAPGIYTKIYAGLGLTAEQSWTLWVTDGTSTDTAASTIHFHNKRYWAPSANAGPLVDADILAFAGAEFGTARQTTKTFDCTGGRYIWMVYPASWGTATFWVAGLQVTFNLTIQNHINASGWTESYYCYRSEYIQNGSNISVEVR
jgi:hypothetical protein